MKLATIDDEARRERLDEIEEAIAEVWRDMGGQDPGIVPWPHWISRALNRLDDERAALMPALDEQAATEAAA